jgi:hypothetical protein
LVQTLDHVRLLKIRTQPADIDFGSSGQHGKHGKENMDNAQLGMQDERRAHPRYKYIKPMQVTVARRILKGYTFDLGQGGLSFILDTIINPSTITIEIPDDNLVVEGKIIRNQPTEKPGLYRHQMQFKDQLPTAVLEEIFG